MRTSKLWVALPKELVESSSLKIFKSRLQCTLDNVLLTEVWTK